MTERDFLGRVAIVTGAGTGIGAAIATSLAASGAQVALVGRSEASLHVIAEGIRQSGGVAKVVPADVASLASVVSAADEIRRQIGRPSILVNNAGIADRRRFEDVPLEELDVVIDVNLRGAIYWSRVVLPDLIEERGDIMNIASLAGVRTYPDWALYCASKHGLVGFAGALAQEMVASGVRVLTVCPGAADTPLWGRAGMTYAGDAKRMLDPKEVAATVLHLLAAPRHVVFKDVLMLPAGEWA